MSDKAEGPLDHLYKAGRADWAPFMGHSVCPDTFEHNVPVLVAEYKRPQGSSSGADVEVWCTATPARFYELRVAARADTPAVVIQTGAGESMTQLAADMALAMSKGMLGVRLVLNVCERRAIVQHAVRTRPGPEAGV